MFKIRLTGTLLHKFLLNTCRKSRLVIVLYIHVFFPLGSAVIPVNPPPPLSMNYKCTLSGRIFHNAIFVADPQHLFTYLAKNTIKALWAAPFNPGEGGGVYF